MLSNVVVGYEEITLFPSQNKLDLGSVSTLVEKCGWLALDEVRTAEAVADNTASGDKVDDRVVSVKDIVAFSAESFPLEDPGENGEPGNIDIMDGEPIDSVSAWSA